MGLPVLQTGSPSFIPTDTGRKITKRVDRQDSLNMKTIGSFPWIPAAAVALSTPSSWHSSSRRRRSPWLTCAVCNGVIIYTIIALSNPDSPPGAVEPTAFVEIFQYDMAKMLGISL
jgi:hypothetical protein